MSFDSERSGSEHWPTPERYAEDFDRRVSEAVQRENPRLSVRNLLYRERAYLHRMPENELRTIYDRFNGTGLIPFFPYSFRFLGHPSFDIFRKFLWHEKAFSAFADYFYVAASEETPRQAYGVRGALKRGMKSVRLRYQAAKCLGTYGDFLQQQFPEYSLYVRSDNGMIGLLLDPAYDPETGDRLGPEILKDIVSLRLGLPQEFLYEDAQVLKGATVSRAELRELFAGPRFGRSVAEVQEAFESIDYMSMTGVSVAAEDYTDLYPVARIAQHLCAPEAKGRLTDPWPYSIRVAGSQYHPRGIRVDEVAWSFNGYPHVSASFSGGTLGKRRLQGASAGFRKKPRGETSPATKADGLSEFIRALRETEPGGLSVGGKVTVLEQEEVPATIDFLRSTRFAAASSGVSFCIPPTGSVDGYIRIVDEIGSRLGGSLWGDPRYRLQMSMPCRLDQKHAALLGIIWYSMQQPVRRYAHENFVSNQPEFAGYRPLVYDAPGGLPRDEGFRVAVGKQKRGVRKIAEEPMHFVFKNERTDILDLSSPDHAKDCAFAQNLIVAAQVPAMLHHDRGVAFVEELSRLVIDEHLGAALNADWVYTRRFGSRVRHFVSQLRSRDTSLGRGKEDGFFRILDEMYTVIRGDVEHFHASSGDRTGFVFRVQDLLVKYQELLQDDIAEFKRTGVIS